MELTYDSTVLERNEMKFLSQYDLIPAKVVDNSLNSKENLMTIDKGRADGVAVDMGVACGNGVVGMVYLVSDHYSVVIPVLNASSSRISCAIRNRGSFGYLHWYGGDPSVAYLEDVPRHAKFKLGEWVVTSGFSSIFPSGVSVGKIEQAYNSRDGLSYKLKIRLSTDFTNLRDVVVISDKSIAERAALLQAARDSINKITGERSGVKERRSKEIYGTVGKQIDDVCDVVAGTGTGAEPRVADECGHAAVIYLLRHHLPAQYREG